MKLTKRHISLKSSQNLIFGGAIMIWGLRCIYRSFFPNLYTDTRLLMEVAEYFVENGVMMHRPIAGTATSAEWVPLTVLPKGYVYLLSAVNAFVQHAEWSVFVVDCLAIGLFIFGTLAVFESLFPSYPRPKVIFLLYLVLSPGLLHPLPATDLLCLALLSCSIYCLLKAYTSEKQYLYLLSGLILTCTAYIRYAYSPFLLMFPICLALFGYQTNTWKVKGLPWFYFSLPPLAFLGVRLISWQSLPFLASQAPGLYVDHLLQVDFFPLKALVYYNDTHIDSLSTWVPTPALWEGIQAGLSLGIMGLAIFTCWRWTYLHPTLSLLGYGMLGLMLSNVGLLFFLSLTTPPERDWLPFWTFVMETRYFAPTQWAILLSLIYRASKSNTIPTEFNNG